MEEESGITFGEICHLIKKRIWWILGISVIVALIAALAVGLVLNRGKNDYSLTFIIDFPGVEEGQYPDGTSFNYESVVYSDQLEAVKSAGTEEDPNAFSNVDTAAMASRGAISIVADTRTTTDSLTSELTGSYTITVSSAYFTDAEQASAFLRALAERTIETVNEKAAGMDFRMDVSTEGEATTYSIAGYDSAQTYANKLSILSSQNSYLLSQYDRLISNGLYTSFQYEGKSMQTLRAEAEASVSTELARLQTELNTYQYVLNDSDALTSIANYVDQLQENTSKIADLQEQYQRDLKTIKDTLSNSQLQVIISALEGYTNEIRALTVENTELRRDIEKLCASIGYTFNEEDYSYVPNASVEVTDKTQFESDLQALYEDVRDNSITAKNAIVALYESESEIVFRQTDVTVIDNSTSVPLIAVAGFVIAFLVMSIIFCAADYPAYKKQRDAKRAEAAAEPDEALAEAAAAEDGKDENS